jgi:hypothetical protein
MRRAGREWEDGRLTLRGVLRQNDEWLSQNWIGFNEGKRALGDPRNTELIRRRADLAYHADARHQRLLEHGGITSSHWILGTEFVRILADVHGMSSVAKVE